eukprot:g19823.t1
MSCLPSLTLSSQSQADSSPLKYWLFSLAWYKQNARRIAKPDAAFKVARYVLSDAPRQRMLVEERGDLESSSTSPNGPPVATQSPTFWTPPPLISSGSIFSEETREV